MLCVLYCPHVFVSFLHNNQYMVHVYGKYILNLDCILQSIMILFFVRYLPINSIYHIWRLLVAWPRGGGGGGGGGGGLQPTCLTTGGATEPPGARQLCGQRFSHMPNSIECLSFLMTQMCLTPGP